MMHPDNYSDGDDIDSIARRCSYRCEILEEVARDLIELATNLKTVLDEYIDTTNPDENEWTARNWNLRKQRIQSAYKEVMLKCSAYKVGTNA